MYEKYWGGGLLFEYPDLIAKPYSVYTDPDPVFPKSF
jgi:hypothetical protein